jgi:hypothetical protein
MEKFKVNYYAQALCLRLGSKITIALNGLFPGPG